jgi:predicted amidohydrolase YtcJ
MRAIRNARPLGGHDPIDLIIDDGVISAILPAGIEAVGPDDLDLGGRFIMPGLWDEHVHFTQWAQHRRRIDLSGAESAAEAAAIVRSSVSQGDARDEVVVGVGFRDGLWPDAPSVALLDAIALDRPIVLISGDVHCVWLNSAALVRFGVDASIADECDGVLREDAAFAITAQLDSAGDGELDRWVGEAAREAAARGVVGVVDLEMRWNHDDWQRRVEAGFDALRVEFGVYPQHLDRALEQGLRTGHAVAGTVAVGPLKVITDGSLNTRTAYCCDPYPDAPAGSYGRLNVPPCELHPLLARASDAGFDLAVHAIGDAANRLALDVFAKLGRGGRIEHAQLVHESDFARFAALGVTASVQPEHLLDDRDVAERYWPGRTQRAFALRSLLDAGAHVVLGSDAPVAPLDPWVAIAAATARTRDERPAFHPEQSITVVEALAASTRTLVSTGEAADLVVLEVDPLTSDAATLRTMPVAATLLGGRVTHADSALGCSAVGEAARS